MKSPADFICAAFFFGASSFFAGLFGLTGVVTLAILGMAISFLLAAFAWNERARFREMREQIGKRQERESLRRAKGCTQGAEWDSGKGGPNA